MATGRTSPEEREVLDEQFAKLARLRVLVLPLPLFVLGTVILHEEAPWRRGALVSFGLIVVVISLLDLVTVLRSRSTTHAPLVNVVVFGLLHPMIVFATGGLDSPMLPVLPATALGIGLFGSLRLAVLLLCVQEAMLVTTALVYVHGWIDGYVPEVLGGAATRTTTQVVLSTIVLGLIMVVAAWGGRVLQSLYVTVLGRSIASRDEALEAHREQARSLTALSAEIAHELKNPLSSVKGLAALIGKDVTGKPGERLAVLRREIGRMEEALEQLLNFSRPTTPLLPDSVDVDACLENVVALHEGLARERNVRLEVKPSSVVVRADPGKLRQVLINLVQNALEASSAGGHIELVASDDGDLVRVEVLDRGEGLDEATGKRVFEPGVTTRARGSGLGLPISRGLMRQHGGELELRSRPGGGTCAVLTLPSNRGAA